MTQSQSVGWLIISLHLGILRILLGTRYMHWYTWYLYALVVGCSQGCGLRFLDRQLRTSRNNWRIILWLSKASTESKVWSRHSIVISRLLQHLEECVLHFFQLLLISSELLVQVNNLQNLCQWVYRNWNFAIGDNYLWLHWDDNQGQGTLGDVWLTMICDLYCYIFSECKLILQIEKI